MEWYSKRLITHPATPQASADSARSARIGLDTGVFTAADLAPVSPPRIALRDPNSPSTWVPNELWSHLAEGELRLSKHFTADNRLYLVAESRPPSEVDGSRLSSREIAVICRLLSGESQKALSYELQLSPSTVATHAGRAFAKLNLRGSSSTVPLAFVLIAQAASGAIALPDATITTVAREGQRYVVANLARPPQDHLASLTCAEREVALALVDGLSKLDVARARSTSINTIGRQVSSVFAKLDVKGRFELIRRMSS
jgi:DNA-binding NarL/FixJ family response regulator